MCLSGLYDARSNIAATAQVLYCWHFKERLYCWHDKEWLYCWNDKEELKHSLQVNPLSSCIQMSSFLPSLKISNRWKQEPAAGISGICRFLDKTSILFSLCKNYVTTKALLSGQCRWSLSNRTVLMSGQSNLDT